MKKISDRTFTFKEVESIADLAFRKGWVQAREELDYPVGGVVPLPEEAPIVDLLEKKEPVSNYLHIIEAAIKKYA